MAQSASEEGIPSLYGDTSLKGRPQTYSYQQVEPDQTTSSSWGDGPKWGPVITVSFPVKKSDSVLQFGYKIIEYEKTAFTPGNLVSPPVAKSESVRPHRYENEESNQHANLVVCSGNEPTLKADSVTQYGFTNPPGENMESTGEFGIPSPVVNVESGQKYGYENAASDQMAHVSEAVEEFPKPDSVMDDSYKNITPEKHESTRISPFLLPVVKTDLGKKHNNENAATEQKAVESISEVSTPVVQNDSIFARLVSDLELESLKNITTSSFEILTRLLLNPVTSLNLASESLISLSQGVSTGLDSIGPNIKSDLVKVNTIIADVCSKIASEATNSSFFSFIPNRVQKSCYYINGMGKGIAMALDDPSFIK